MSEPCKHQRNGVASKSYVGCMWCLVEELQAENQRLREALEKISCPLTALARDAERDGNVLDGQWALRLIESPGFYRDIAELALKQEE